VILNQVNFPNSYQVFEFIWDCLKKYYQKYEGEVDKDYFVAECMSSRSLELISEDEWEFIELLINTAFGIPRERVREDICLQYFKEFAEDCLRESLVYTGGEDLGSILEDVSNKYHTIKLVGESLIDGDLPLEWDANKYAVRKVPSGIPWLDMRFLNGGLGKGELIGLMGPYGSGKTTFSVQVSTELAVTHYLKYKDGFPSLGFVYLFSYEIDEIRLKMLAASSVARIALSRLESCSFDEFTSVQKGSLQPYERKALAEMGLTEVLGERERYQLARQWLTSWRPVYMLQFPENFNQTSLVKTIAHLVEQHQESVRQQGIECHVAGIFIDYLLAAVKRVFLNHKSVDFRQLVMKFVWDAKEGIATYFDCPVWIVNQFNSKGNRLPAGVVPSGADAAECNTFGENLDFLFLLSKADNEGRLVFRAGKHRRTKPPGDAILQWDNEFARFRDVSDRFVFDSSSKQFIQKGSSGTKAPAGQL